jgi:metal-responsive CopG/Arc/MetJ family transcriptional regulator
MAVLDRPVRFDIRMPADLAEDMQEIEDSTGMSRAEIFRRAIALYKRAKQTEKGKGNVILRNSDGTLREVIGF